MDQSSTGRLKRMLMNRNGPSAGVNPFHPLRVLSHSMVVTLKSDLNAVASIQLPVVRRVGMSIPFDFSQRSLVIYPMSTRLLEAERK